MPLAQLRVKGSLFDDFKALVYEFKALLIGEFGAVLTQDAPRSVSRKGLFIR